jgi:putative PIN family toxin of toxin-antitoxin system
MIWVVCDSNVYVSALVFGGIPRRVLEGVELNLFALAVSDPIKADVERVLVVKFAWPEVRVREATSYLWSLAHPVVPKQTIKDCVDPDDNRILECALEAQARVIVTGDNHLLRLSPYYEILILTPKQFIETQPWRG